jgi:hypothetical protein
MSTLTTPSPEPLVGQRFSPSTVASQIRAINAMPASPDPPDPPSLPAAAAKAGMELVTSIRARFEQLSIENAAPNKPTVKPVKHWAAHVVAHDPADAGALFKATVGRFKTKRVSDANWTESPFFRLPGGM